MHKPAHDVMKSIIALTILSGALAAPPAFAGRQGTRFDLGGEHLNDETCHTVSKAERLIKRSYTNVAYEPKYSTSEVYFFYATKPKNEKISWHLYYDACEQEIIRKESQE